MQRDAHGGGEPGGIGARGKSAGADDVAPGEPRFLRRSFLSVGIVESPNPNPAQGLRDGQRQRGGGTLAEQRNGLLTAALLRIAFLPTLALQFDERPQSGILGRDGV